MIDILPTELTCCFNAMNRYPQVAIAKEVNFIGKSILIYTCSNKKHTHT